MIRSFTLASLLLPPLFSHQATLKAPGHVWLPRPAPHYRSSQHCFKWRWETCFLLCPSVLTPSLANLLVDIHKWTGPVWGKDMAFPFKTGPQRAEYRDKWENIMGRDHAMLSFGHTRACEIFWPITFKPRAPKAKHYITSRLINKLTPSESKHSKITLHQTGTFHIHSLFLPPSPQPQDLARIPGQCCNYWVLIVFYEVWEILSYFWTWNTMVFISDWAWKKKRLSICRWRHFHSLPEEGI